MLEVPTLPQCPGAEFLSNFLSSSSTEAHELIITVRAVHQEASCAGMLRIYFLPVRYAAGGASPSVLRCENVVNLSCGSTQNPHAWQSRLWLCLGRMLLQSSPEPTCCPRTTDGDGSEQELSCDHLSVALELLQRFRTCWMLASGNSAC